MKRVTVMDRQAQIVALRAEGKTQREIGTLLNVSAASINRALAGQEHNVEAVQKSMTQALMDSIEKHITTEDRAVRYAELAKHAKNEAVSLASLTRIDDLQGIVTERERMRIDRQTAAPQVQPIFSFAGGLNIAFGPQQVVEPAPVLGDNASKDE